MNARYFSRRVATVAILFCFSVASVFAKNKTVNSFEKPDFAFPVTVEKNADSALKKSLASGNDIMALKAMMQIYLAKGKVSNDSAAAWLPVISEITGKFKDPAAIALALLFEADCYGKTEKDRTKAAQTVSLLIEDAFKTEGIWDIPLAGQAGNVLTLTKDSDEAELTVGDFVCMKGYSLLGEYASGERIIPFSGVEDDENKVESLRTRLARAIVSHNEEKDKDQALVQGLLLLASQKGVEEKQFLIDNIKRLENKPVVVYLYQRLADFYDVSDVVMKNNPEGIEFYRSLLSLESKISSDQNISASERNRFSDAVKSIIAVYTQPHVSLNCERNFVAGKEITGTAEIQNIDKIYLLLVEIPTGVDSAGYDVYDFYIEGNKIKRTPVETAVVEVNGNVPFSSTEKWSFRSPGAGRYVLIPSASVSLSDALGGLKRDYEIINVSDVAAVDVSVRKGKESEREIYVVSSKDMTPVEKAEIRFYKSRWIKGKSVKSLLCSRNSDMQGRVSAPADYDYAIVTKDKSRFYLGNYNDSYYSPTSVRTSASLFTDLSVYHPGDTVKFATVVYDVDNGNHSAEVAAGRRVKQIFRDANGVALDTIAAMTDGFGRCSGQFLIPSGKLLGSYSIECLSEKQDVKIGSDDSGRWSDVGQCRFEVAEYKTPKFYVVTRDVEADSAGNIVIEGVAKTFSGMPVADAKTEITINWRPLWWRNFRMTLSPARYQTSVKTDVKGNFYLELGCDSLRNTDYRNGVFTVSVACTDNSGETQNANPVRFSFGKGLHLEYAGADRYDVVSDTIPIKVLTRNFIDKEVEEKLNYTLCVADTDKEVASGVFVSPLLKLDVRNIESGRYLLKVGSSDNEVESMERTIVFFRDSDKRPPIETALWVMNKEIIAGDDAKECVVKVGNSFESGSVLCVISGSSDGVAETRWLEPHGGIINVNVPAPKEGERIWVNLSGMHDFKAVRKTIEIKPASSLKKLLVKAESFRDKVVPGSKERWKFEFVSPAGVDPQVAAVLVVYDKALESISRNNWYFAPRAGLYWNNPVSVYNPTSSTHTFNYWKPVSQKGGMLAFSQPDWQLYGQQLWNKYGLRIRGTKSAAGVVVQESFDEDGAVNLMERKSVAYATVAMAESSDDAYVGAVADSGSLSDSNGDNTPLRETQHPSGAFMPNLLSDESGNLNVDFTIPDFNTTWKVRLVGYDRELYSVIFDDEFEASKPVMVSMNNPRFVRQGDVVTLKGRLYNNSESENRINATFAVYDFFTGTLIAEQVKKDIAVAPMAESIVDVSFEIPDNVSALRVKCVAADDLFSDGEQQVVAVLPAFENVIETKPFYIGASEKSTKISIPRLGKDDLAGLSVCSNPVWYCVTALPAVYEPNSSNLLSILNSYYAGALSLGLSERFPAIDNALKKWNSDSDRKMLSSAMDDDNEFRVLLTEQTPFVGAADAETLRMSSLVGLLDRVKAGNLLNTLIDDIKALQNFDGGWSWCQGMPSSMFMTQEALHHFAMLKGSGYLPDYRDLNDMIKKGFSYVDKIYEKEYSRDKKHFSYASLINYLYCRGFFRNIDEPALFRTIKRNALNEMKASWKNYDVFQKATVYMILKDEGENGVASEILESLRQYASYGKQGVWFDNLGSGYNGMSRLTVTTRVLEAFVKSKTDSTMVEGIRQWLVFNRQTQDWGSKRGCAEVINAILTSGVDWLVDGTAARVRINGEEIALPKGADMTGAFEVPLDANRLSGATVEIINDGNVPSWGGVSIKKKASLRDIEEVSLPGLRISKSIELADGVNGDALKIGDLVHITLTVTSDRDMDYVSVIDNRSACLEPVDQLSGYTFTDGIGCYREVRDTRTSFFFNFLPKGKHEISYDCRIGCEGEFLSGTATVQSQYAPLMTAVSSALKLVVE